MNRLHLIPWGGTPYKDVKGYFFTASGMWKGKDFTSWGIWKKVGKSVISVYKDAKKRLADAAILWLWKSRENFLVLRFIPI